MDSPQQHLFVLMMVILPSFAGCASLWQEIPSPAPADPQVRLDAAWFHNSPSPDVVNQIKQERKQHIENTLKQRDAGKVSVSLQEMLRATATDASIGETPTDSSLPSSPELSIDTGNPSVVGPSQSGWNALTGHDANSDEADVTPGQPVSASHGKMVIQLADGTEFSR